MQTIAQTDLEAFSDRFGSFVQVARHRARSKWPRRSQKYPNEKTKLEASGLLTSGLAII